MNSGLQFWLKKIRMRVVFPLLARLPAKLSYQLATFIGYLDYKYLNTAERLEVAQQMRQVPVFDAQHIDNYALQFCQLMARDTLDSYRMSRMTAANMAHQLDVVGLAHLVAAEQRGKGVLLLVPHYGRYFMLGPALRFLGHGFGVFTTAITEATAPDENWRTYLTQKLKNGFMFCQGEWITSDDSPLRIYNCLKAGHSLLMAFDGVESTSDKKMSVPFLGGTAHLATGSLRIAKRTGAAMIYVSVKEQGAGLKFELTALPEDPELALEQAAALLAKDIEEMPWHWWLWRALPRVWSRD
jgi:lauroyl/myristoyl acyltransferase